MPVASMSKLVTAMATIFSIPATTTITITDAETKYPPDGSNLQAGEKFEAGELLYPMLLDSSNIAAEALASSTDRIKFLEFMSSYSWEIGMPDTFFADPSGISPYNISDANDIFALAKYLYAYHEDILGITRTVHLAVGTTSDHGSHNFDSIHPFVKDSRFIGGKTGRTPEAGETMLTILDINGEPIAFIILGADIGYRKSDTEILIKKYLDQYAESAHAN
jgi:D-alanyl-D-alanine endopeptidase (penicillin-binding protein 7)